MRRQLLLLYPRAHSALPNAIAGRRGYHDESFGFRKPRKYVFPDYTQTQLQNRAANAALLRYVDSMRTHGHRAARIDPLDLIYREEVAALSPARYGLVDEEKKYNVNGILWTKRVGELGEQEQWWSLREITEHLRKIYVSNIAYEYMHSPSKSERLWFSHLLESKSLPSPEDAPPLVISEEKKRRIHELLARSEVFDNFLQLKFPKFKRYGLEGGESVLPALDSLFSAASQAGIRDIILTAPHRGRLNLLTVLLQYSPAGLFHKIQGGSEIPDDLGAEGDLFLDLAASPSLSYDGVSTPIKVSLLPNPLHLEAINPVAIGKTRAKQYALLKNSPKDCKLGDRVMCVQLHGDTSFTGQGVVMESLQLSNLPHFTSGGSVHLIIDNNIGCTTSASNARSSLYCSDVGKMINTPVLHVNGDYPEDVARVMDTAFKYRSYFRKDIIVDLLVYRRWHNELDIPGLTNPLMYEKIAARQCVPQLYEEKLMSDNVLTACDISSVRSSYKDHLEAELAKGGSYIPPPLTFQGEWEGMIWPANEEARHNPETGVDRTGLEKVGRASIAVPEGFKLHPSLQTHVKNRLQSIESGKGIDFATAEALAFGSLMLQGVDVRISGQDIGRGTFSHRHAMLVDQKTEGITVPLNDELRATGKLELANSSLSELAVLGFEYGASWERPNVLSIWEAQFGDFFNGAQVIIDTFVSSSESKWLLQSGVVMMLPHGLEGDGPEHSSARIERMLQLTNDRYSPDGKPANINMHVAFPTTPAQYFHLLRRQICRNFRKPLVIAGPKGLLRLPTAASSITDMESGTRFQPVLSDPIDNRQAVSVVMLSGKIYYELIKERQTRDLNDKVAFIRIEELAPFPFDALEEALSLYPSAVHFAWLQEEPRNQGAWNHVRSRIEKVLSARTHLSLRRSLNCVIWDERRAPCLLPGSGSYIKSNNEALLNRHFEYGNKKAFTH